MDNTAFHNCRYFCPTINEKLISKTDVILDKPVSRSESGMPVGKVEDIIIVPE